MRRPSSPRQRRTTAQTVALFLVCSLLLAQGAVAQILGLGLGGLLDLSLDFGGLIDVAASLNSIALGGGLLSITAPCSCGDFEWNGGNVALSGAGSLQLTGQSNAYAFGGTLSGGSFGCGSAGKLIVQSGSDIALQGCSLNNAQLQLANYGNLRLQHCSVPSGLHVQGSSYGSASVESGTTVCSSSCLFEAPCKVQPSGNLQAYGAGQVKIRSSQATVYAGQCTGDTASALARAGSNFCIGGAAGSAPAALVFARSPQYPTSPCHINGGVYELRQSGQLQVASGAKAIISSPCQTVSAVDHTSGSGVVRVAGELQCQAAHTSTVPVQVVSGGVHTLNCGAQHSYSSLSYAAGSTANLAASSTGYKAVHVSGPCQLAGHLNIQPGSYAPSGPVTLYQAGQVQGAFSSCSSSSATVKGAVKTTATSVVWYPTASQCGGGCLPVA